MQKAKIIFTTIMSALMSWLGILAVPVFLMLGCNIMDYITGLFAAKYRDDGGISSYKSIRGIIKKVCMWLMVIIGAIMDGLINYAVAYVGIDFSFPFIVATIVAVWIICNEIISILENMLDIGVDLPPFLMPLVKYIKKQVEDKGETNVQD